jgi:hypothetical protein
MALKEQFRQAKERLLSDAAICPENRVLFTEFFAYQEYKLKRLNGIPSLDDGCYRTLLAYVSRLRAVNRWFENKPWKQLTKADIQRVYDDVEDGKILTLKGAPVRDKVTMYRKIIRGKPFEMAGQKTVVSEVMQFTPYEEKEEVRFFGEAEFRQLVDVMPTTEQRAFFWLCWDIGENAASLLRLRKRDCIRQISAETKAAEYLINLRRETLKRARRSRSEITNYKDTTDYLDRHLKALKEDDMLFAREYAWAKKIFARAVTKTGVQCRPGGQHPTLKDLRSSMACDLLTKHWTTDEVNARLGHKPSSRQLDRYASYLAIDRLRPKRQFQASKMSKMEEEMAEMRESEVRLSRALERNKVETAHYKALTRALGNIVKLKATRDLGRMEEKEFTRQLAKAVRSLATFEALADGEAITEG